MVAPGTTAADLSQQEALVAKAATFPTNFILGGLTVAVVGYFAYRLGEQKTVAVQRSAAPPAAPLRRALPESPRSAGVKAITSQVVEEPEIGPAEDAAKAYLAKVAPRVEDYYKANFDGEPLPEVMVRSAGSYSDSGYAAIPHLPPEKWVQDMARACAAKYKVVALYGLDPEQDNTVASVVFVDASGAASLIANARDQDAVELKKL